MSDEKSYVVRSTAGKEVAGFKNPGKGKHIKLTDLQAEHPLRLGHIKLVERKAAEAEQE